MTSLPFVVSAVVNSDTITDIFGIELSRPTHGKVFFKKSLSNMDACEDAANKHFKIQAGVLSVLINGTTCDSPHVSGWISA